MAHRTLSDGHKGRAPEAGHTSPPMACVTVYTPPRRDAKPLGKALSLIQTTNPYSRQYSLSAQREEGGRITTQTEQGMMGSRQQRAPVFLWLIKSFREATGDQTLIAL